jgi:Uma2 family endonuclease
MYDLPSENPEDPGLPDIFHDQQPQLLKETFRPPAYPKENVFVASDLNLYYDRHHDHWYKRPDWFAVVGVSHLYQGRDQRYSYVMWDEKVTPILVVELLSPGTEDEDQGRTPPPTKGPPNKWDVYEKILQIPYYVIYSRHTEEVQFFKLTQGRYVKIPSPTHTLWMPEVQLGLGRWKGVYDDCERHWLRWYTADGQWVPTPAERAEMERQQAEIERQRAETERQRAETERERASRAEQQVMSERERAVRAEQQVELERRRAQQWLAKLRELGIDPELLSKD